MTSPWIAPGQPASSGQGPSAPAEPTAPGTGGAPLPSHSAPGGVRRELSPHQPLFPLRPLGVGEVLSAGAAMYRHRRRLVLGTSAVVLGISSLLQAVTTGALLVPSMVAGSEASFEESGAAIPLFPGEGLTAVLATLAGWLVSMAVSIIAVQLVTVLMVRAAVDQVRQEELSDAELRGLMFRRGLRASIAGLIVSVVMLLPPALLGGVAFLPIALSGEPPTWMVVLPILGVALGLLISAYLTARLILSTPVIAVEDQGIFAALARAVRLTSGRLGWRMLGLGLLVMLISVIATQMISSVFGMVGLFAMLMVMLATQAEGVMIGTIVLTVISFLGGYVATVVVVPFTCGTLAAAYADVRMRKEGWDAQLLAQRSAAEEMGL